MVSVGKIPFKQVLKMLKACAPGHTIKDKTHLKWITYKDKTYKASKGPHGSSDNFGVQIGEVKGLVRHFDILECAQKHLSQLQKKKSSQPKAKPKKGKQKSNRS